jgi:hypothetical protein
MIERHLLGRELGYEDERFQVGGDETVKFVRHSLPHEVFR